MGIPLLESKLHVPRRRRGIVSRDRLEQRLNRGALPPVILVSAPAGFGKTTLLAEWFATEAGAGSKWHSAVGVSGSASYRSLVWTMSPTIVLGLPRRSVTTIGTYAAFPMWRDLAAARCHRLSGKICLARSR